ncbi:MAG: hypothetical protein JXB39_03635 [Deltaproteobacteria bacterium]|nr:hypothetical protein [Deltaproteobacteria bacterium]
MRLRLLGVLLLLLALGCLCGRGAEETGDSTPVIDTNTDTGIPGGSFWGEYATALCEHYERCEPEFFTTYYETMENCVAVLEDELSSGASAYEGCTFDESNAEICIHYIEAADCKGFELPQACQSLFICAD